MAGSTGVGEGASDGLARKAASVAALVAAAVIFSAIFSGSNSGRFTAFGSFFPFAVLSVLSLSSVVVVAGAVAGGVSVAAGEAGGSVVVAAGSGSSGTPIRCQKRLLSGLTFSLSCSALVGVVVGAGVVAAGAVVSGAGAGGAGGGGVATGGGGAAGAAIGLFDGYGCGTKLVIVFTNILHDREEVYQLGGMYHGIACLLIHVACLHHLKRFFQGELRNLRFKASQFSAHSFFKITAFRLEQPFAEAVLLRLRERVQFHFDHKERAAS